MGNLGKFKRKVRKKSAFVEITAPEADDKDMELMLGFATLYFDLLESKEWDKVKDLVLWANKTRDPYARSGIDMVNGNIVEQLGGTYFSLKDLNKKISFLVDNPQYVEDFFSQKNSLPQEQDIPTFHEQKRLVDQIKQYVVTIEPSFPNTILSL